MTRESRVIKLLLSIFSIGLLCVLSACGIATPGGSVAVDEKNIVIFAICLMLLVVVPVIILTLIFTFRYRASKDAKYDPEWSKSKRVEILFWVIPCAIILVLGCVAWISSHSLDPFRPLPQTKTVKPLEIQVVSLNWKWLFIYPEQNIATVNDVRFPENVPVVFKLTSDAPMNAFMILGLGTQIYTMPGMQTQVSLIANRTGSFYGLSTAYSGNGYEGMHFRALSMTQNDFDAWVTQVQNTGTSLTEMAYRQLIEPSRNVPSEYYSSVEQGLFVHVIRKYGFIPTIGKDL